MGEGGGKAGIRLAILRNFTLSFCLAFPFLALSFHLGSVSADSGNWLPILQGLLEIHHALLPAHMQANQNQSAHWGDFPCCCSYPAVLQYIQIMSEGVDIVGELNVS